MASRIDARLATPWRPYTRNTVCEALRYLRSPKTGRQAQRLRALRENVRSHGVAPFRKGQRAFCVLFERITRLGARKALADVYFRRFRVQTRSEADGLKWTIGGPGATRCCARRPARRMCAQCMEPIIDGGRPPLCIEVVGGEGLGSVHSDTPSVSGPCGASWPCESSRRRDPGMRPLPVRLPPDFLPEGSLGCGPCSSCSRGRRGGRELPR